MFLFVQPVVRIYAISTSGSDSDDESESDESPGDTSSDEGWLEKEL